MWTAPKLLFMSQNSQEGFLFCLSRVWEKYRLPLKYKRRFLPCLSFPNKLYISFVWVLSKFLLCQLNLILYYALRLPVPPVLFLIALLLAHRLLMDSPDWAAVSSCPSCDLMVNPSISFPLFPSFFFFLPLFHHFSGFWLLSTLFWLRGENLVHFVVFCLSSLDG